MGYLSDLTTEHGQPGYGEKAAKEGKTEKVDPGYGRGGRRRPTT